MTLTSLERIHEQPLTAAEAASFQEVIDHFNLPEVDVELVEEAHALAHINEELDHADLQAGRAEELKKTRDELLAEFLEHPQEAFMAEVLNYARLCENRSISWQDTLGTKVTEFVTSNKERTKADLLFRISEFDSGVVQVMAEVPLRREEQDSGEPFTITADTMGRFRIEQRTFGRGSGGSRHVELPLGQEGHRAEDRLKLFFMHSTEAVHLAYTRKPAERETSDELAMRLLYAKKRGHDDVIA